MANNNPSFKQLQLLATKTLVMKNTETNRNKVATQLDDIATDLRGPQLPPKGKMLTLEQLHRTLNLFGHKCSKDVIIRSLQHEWNDTDRNFPRSSNGGTAIATYREAHEALQEFWKESYIYRGKCHAKHEPTGTLYIVDPDSIV